jgi:hypothetical protein
VAIIGAVVVALSVFLPWLGDIGSDLFGIGSDSDPALDKDLPFLSLFDFGGEGVAESIFSVGLVLLVLAVIGLALSFSPATSGVRRTAGVLVLLVWLLFTIRTVQFVFVEIEEAGDFLKYYGIGAVVGLIGGILMVAGRHPRQTAVT